MENGKIKYYKAKEEMEMENMEKKRFYITGRIKIIGGIEANNAKEAREEAYERLALVVKQLNDLVSYGGKADFRFELPEASIVAEELPF